MSALFCLSRDKNPAGNTGPIRLYPDMRRGITPVSFDAPALFFPAPLHSELRFVFYRPGKKDHPAERIPVGNLALLHPSFRGDARVTPSRLSSRITRASLFVSSAVLFLGMPAINESLISSPAYALGLHSLPEAI